MLSISFIAFVTLCVCACVQDWFILFFLKSFFFPCMQEKHTVKMKVEVTMLSDFILPAYMDVF